MPTGEYSLSLGGHLFPDPANRRLRVGPGGPPFLAVRAVEPCAVAGQLFGLTEDEARHAVVVAVGAGTLQVAVDRGDASFSVPSLPPGEWEFHAATTKDRRVSVARVSCEDGGSLAVELVFSAPAANGR